MYIVKELCRGLAYAHTFRTLKLVHRDVSPPNVLLSYSGEVKLTDFGLASSTLKIEKTAPGIIYGKVSYMSPEQARGEKLDGRTDSTRPASSCGSCSPGRQLFPPGKDAAAGPAVARRELPSAMPPSQARAARAGRARRICMKALAAEQADRYQDCEELRTALQSWLAATAPTTDATRMAKFLAELFADDIETERSRARGADLAHPHARAHDAADRRAAAVGREVEPDQGRPRQQPRIDDESTDVTDPLDLAQAAEGGDAPVRRPSSVGRRATDREVIGNDRRRVDDRRGIPGRAASPVALGAAAVAQAEADPVSPGDVELVAGSEVDGRYRVGG